MKRLRIAQISDIHITPDGSLTKGVDVQAQLLSVLDKLTAQHFDALVVSGDLAVNDGEAEAYRWIQEQLNDFPAPVLYMVGNHDRFATMQQHLQLLVPSSLPDVYCFVYRLSQHPLLFLDTGSHVLSQAQMDWLRATSANIKENILLFIHHPPLYCGCEFMDGKHYLRNREEVWATLQQIPNIHHIFCGHYHTERTISRDGKQVFITPSTMLQIGTQGEKFSVEHIRPGWREIEWDGEQLNTHVHYRKD